MSIKLIVGLANPGPQYAKTRHNAGAWFIQAIANQHSLPFKTDKKFQGMLAELREGSEVRRLLMPSTFMNLSGDAVASVARFYDLAADEILVAHDELDFDPGQARLKFAGGHGGHNGLRDIFDKLGSKEFYRLRLGIGKPHGRQTPADFVLSAPPKEEQTKIDEAIERVLQTLPLLLTDEMEEAMKRINTEAEDGI